MESATILTPPSTGFFKKLYFAFHMNPIFLKDQNITLEDLKVPRRSPDLFNNVKIGQGQLPLIFCFTIYGDCSHFGQVT